MTRELKEICRHEAPTLVKELIRLATVAESEVARVAAIKEMYGGRGSPKGGATISPRRLPTRAVV
jgi:hypothetical protein